MEHQLIAQECCTFQTQRVISLFPKLKRNLVILTVLGQALIDIAGIFLSLWFNQIFGFLNEPEQARYEVRKKMPSLFNKNMVYSSLFFDKRTRHRM
jgi:hypothetical protein